MVPEKSILPAELAIDPEEGGKIRRERDQLRTNFGAPLSAIHEDTIFQYCTFLALFSFLISAGLLVNLFLKSITL
jgi:hypothetical protein